MAAFSQQGPTWEPCRSRAPGAALSKANPWEERLEGKGDGGDVALWLLFSAPESEGNQLPKGPRWWNGFLYSSLNMCSSLCAWGGALASHSPAWRGPGASLPPQLLKNRICVPRELQGDGSPQFHTPQGHKPLQGLLGKCFWGGASGVFEGHLSPNPPQIFGSTSSWSCSSASPTLAAAAARGSFGCRHSQTIPRF